MSSYSVPVIQNAQKPKAKKSGLLPQLADSILSLVGAPTSVETSQEQAIGKACFSAFDDALSDIAYPIRVDSDPNYYINYFEQKLIKF